MYKQQFVRRVFTLSLILITLSAILPTTAAHASTTWTVRSTADGLPNAAHCPGLGCRLRDAIAAAGSGDTIKFAVTGTITLTQGELDINNMDLTITGPGSASLTIDANNNSRIFSIFAAGPLGSTVTISGLRLRHGLANDANSAVNYVAGGAILVYGAALNLNGMVINSNVVSCADPCNNNGLNGNGAGIAASTGTALTMTNSTVSNNFTNQSGGGIFFNPGTSAGEDLSLTTVSVTGNHATDVTNGAGGGILVGNAHAVTLTGVTVSNNVAGNAGGGLMMGAPATITGSTFSGNQALGSGSGIAGGGGIYVSAAPLVMSGSTISGNTSAQGGGGISVNSNSVTIDQSTIQNNTSQDAANQGWSGAGILVLSGRSLVLSNSLVSGNTSPDNGGGIWLGGSSTMTGWNDTFTANSAGGNLGGGAIYNQSATLTLYNSTLVGNVALQGHAGALYQYSGTSTLTNDLMANSIDAAAPVNAISDCAYFAGGGSNMFITADLVRKDDTTNRCPGITDYIVDPLVGPLADNGGPTKTMALLAGSGAIDAGSNTICADAATVNNLDQRGKARPADGDNNGTIQCDIGAYEFHPKTVSLSSTSLDFGNQLVGTGATQLVTLTNAGDQTLTLTGSISAAAPYAVAATSTCPLGGGTLAPWKSCKLRVRFSPTVVGPAAAASISITSNAASSPDSISLAGTGVAGTQLIQNPSFELDNNHDTRPDMFTYSSLTSSDKQDCTVHKFDLCSLKLTGNAATKTANQTVLQSGVAGDDFTFKLWSKASSVPAGSTYRLQVRFYNGKTLLATKTMDFGTGTHSFQSVSGTFTAPSAYTKVSFRIIFLASSGTAWFDGAALNWAP